MFSKPLLSMYLYAIQNRGKKYHHHHKKDEGILSSKKKIHSREMNYSGGIYGSTHEDSNRKTKI